MNLYEESLPVHEILILSARLFTANPQPTAILTPDFIMHS